MIYQKAIGTGSTKAREERKTASKETPDIEHGDKPEAPKAGPNGLIEKICKNCNETFFTENPRKETCSGSCRTAFSLKKKSK